LKNYDHQLGDDTKYEQLKLEYQEKEENFLNQIKSDKLTLT